ncbi:methylenetetrahydrofolate dehydrogenase (NADP+)/methenyltetrahydrofolate cyclohydrolase [Deinobacterium chartae]|uniref:Bifunctional protein FolD n=1 Tax=Deinobacterium chartae TaxID=521158 RepID=A0A841HVI4_9DEIO|nr:methylenetetrahydrofolate dehydrogenase (NADP+)/methenyltetrahydrofolate cyclohydrolase [Deinobacterium chartae]
MASRLRAEVRAEVRALREAGVRPRMSVVVASDDPATRVYVSSKAKTAEALGLEFTVVDLGSGASQSHLEATLDGLSRDPEVHGVMLEFPLSRGLDPDRALRRICPEKDVEGLTPGNLGLIAAGRESEALLAPTPQACLLLAATQGELRGERVAVVGPGRTVGRPLIHMLINHGATVTVVTEGTRDVRAALEGCRFVFVAVGRAALLGPDQLHDGQIVIDAGINVNEGGVCGDVNPAVYPRLAAYTPVPGGVGPVTSVLVFRNFVRALRLQRGENVHDR